MTREVVDRDVGDFHLRPIRRMMDVLWLEGTGATVVMTFGAVDTGLRANCRRTFLMPLAPVNLN